MDTVLKEEEDLNRFTRWGNKVGSQEIISGHFFGGGGGRCQSQVGRDVSPPELIVSIKKCENFWWKRD